MVKQGGHEHPCEACVRSTVSQPLFLSLWAVGRSVLGLVLQLALQLALLLLPALVPLARARPHAAAGAQLPDCCLGCIIACTACFASADPDEVKKQHDATKGDKRALSAAQLGTPVSVSADVKEMFKAVMAEDIERLKALIAQGGSVEATNAAGKSLLEVAEERSKPASVKFLKEQLAFVAPAQASA